MTFLDKHIISLGLVILIWEGGATYECQNMTIMIKKSQPNIMKIIIYQKFKKKQLEV